MGSADRNSIGGIERAPFAAAFLTVGISPIA